MNDYRVAIKVRNNRILKAIEAVGGTPGQIWCEANGVSYTGVNNLINMTSSPATTTGALTPTARKLCDVLDKLPEDLWSDDQIRPLERNFTSLEMSREQVMSLMAPEDTGYLTDFEGLIDRERLGVVMERAISTLDERKQRILRARFFENKTLEKIGEEFGISKEYARAIEARALRELRHPTKSGVMRQFLDSYEEEKPK